MPNTTRLLTESLARTGIQESQLPGLGVPATWLNAFKVDRATIDDLSDSELEVFLKATGQTERFWRGVSAMRRSRNTMTEEAQQHFFRQYMKR